MRTPNASEFASVRRARRSHPLSFVQAPAKHPQLLRRCGLNMTKSLSKNENGNYPFEARVVHEACSVDILSLPPEDETQRLNLTHANDWTSK